MKRLFLLLAFSIHTYGDDCAFDLAMASEQPVPPMQVADVPPAPPATPVAVTPPLPEPDPAHKGKPWLWKRVWRDGELWFRAEYYGFEHDWVFLEGHGGNFDYETHLHRVFPEKSYLNLREHLHRVVQQSDVQPGTAFGGLVEEYGCMDPATGKMVVLQRKGKIGEEHLIPGQTAQNLIYLIGWMGLAIQ